jgi:hypothetical protein
MESVSINRTAARLVVFRVGRDQRILRRRSARYDKRGVRSDQGLGVAKLGTDGPARRSRWLSSAWWTGPPPIPRRGPPTGHKQDDQTAKAKPPAGSCSRILGQSLRPTRVRPSGNRPPERPSTIAGPDRGWAGRSPPLTPKQLASHRTPDPNVDVPRSGHLSVESKSLSLIR